MDNAIALARGLCVRFEGCRLAPYRDAAGNWTVGYGSRWLADGRPVTNRTPTIIAADAEALLDITLARLAAQVWPLLPFGATDWQRGAVLDFAYNEGLHALKTSKLLAFFQRGDLLNAAIQFGAWIYAGGKPLPGPIERRRAESDMFAGIGFDHEQYHDDPGAADALNAAELREIGP